MLVLWHGLSAVFFCLASQRLTAHWNRIGMDVSKVLLGHGFSIVHSTSSPKLLHHTTTSHPIPSNCMTSHYTTSLDMKRLTWHHIASHDIRSHNMTPPHPTTLTVRTSPRNQTHNIIPHHMTAHHITTTDTADFRQCFSETFENLPGKNLHVMQPPKKFVPEWPIKNQNSGTATPMAIEKLDVYTNFCQNFGHKRKILANSKNIFTEAVHWIPTGTHTKPLTSTFCRTLMHTAMNLFARTIFVHHVQNVPVGPSSNYSRALDHRFLNPEFSLMTHILM